MSEVTLTSKQFGQINDLLFMAQKRLINPMPHDLTMAQSQMQEVQNILTSCKIGEKSKDADDISCLCEVCGKKLESSDESGVLYIKPCSDCLQAEREYKKEIRDEEETYGSLKREMVRDHNRRVG